MPGDGGDRVGRVARWRAGSANGFIGRRPRLRLGGDDVDVGAAAAQVAAHPLADLVVGRARASAARSVGDVARASRPRLRRASRRPSRSARGAVAALEAVLVEEGLLHRVQLVPVGQARGGDDLGAVLGDREGEAGVTRRPSSSTVHAPHWPWSQPFFGAVTPSCSRSASSRVVRVSTRSACRLPSTRRVTSVKWADSMGGVPGAEVVKPDAAMSRVWTAEMRIVLPGFPRDRSLRGMGSPGAVCEPLGGDAGTGAVCSTQGLVIPRSPSDREMDATSPQPAAAHDGTRPQGS